MVLPFCNSAAAAPLPPPFALTGPPPYSYFLHSSSSDEEDIALPHSGEAQTQLGTTLRKGIDNRDEICHDVGRVSMYARGYVGRR